VDDSDDGDPIKVPAGVCRIEVLTDPIRIIENITVSADREAVVRVKGEL